MTRQRIDRTPEEKRRLVAEVDRLVASGLGKNEAFRKIGIHSTNYHDWTTGKRAKEKAEKK